MFDYYCFRVVSTTDIDYINNVSGCQHFNSLGQTDKRTTFLYVTLISRTDRISSDVIFAIFDNVAVIIVTFCVHIIIY